jgi:phosphonate transport system ATP-binding protein
MESAIKRSAEPAVVLRGVGKVFGNGIAALNDVSLSVSPGSTVIVLGPSGAGKSTLLRMINGLETPSSGDITLCGQPVEKRRLREVRRQAGMVFQQFNLVPRLSVMANVLCGRLSYRNLLTSLFFVFPKSDFDLANSALKRVGLEGRSWDSVSRLSGGQQQRVAIARTLVQECKVVLADEPVASLDPATSEDIMQLLVEAAKERGTTLIVNLHQVELAKKFGERIVGMKKGQIIFDLRADELTDERVNELYR